MIMAALTSAQGTWIFASQQDVERTRGVKDQRVIDMKKKKNWHRGLISPDALWRSGPDVESVLVDMHSGGFSSTRCASRELEKGWLRTICGALS